MRILIFILAMGFRSMAFATEPGCGNGLDNVHTQDNLNYAAIFEPGLSSQDVTACLERIKTLAQGRGTGVIDHLKLIDVVLLNLTSAAARDIGALDCVHAIEQDRMNTI